MNLYSKFAEALPLAEFLAQFGSASDQQRWQAVHNEVALTESQRVLLAKFKRETHAESITRGSARNCLR